VAPNRYKPDSLTLSSASTRLPELVILRFAKDDKLYVTATSRFRLMRIGRDVVAPLAGARFVSMFDPLLHLSYSSAKEQRFQFFL